MDEKSESVTQKNMLDHRLRHMYVRSDWGCQQLGDSIYTVEDKEYMMVVGSRVVIYDEESGVYGSKTILPTIQEVDSVISIEVSADKKYVAICAKNRTALSTALLLVCDIEAQRQFPKRPKEIKYEEPYASHSEFHFASARFSADSKYLACFTNRTIIGVLIYDWALAKLIQTIQVKSMLSEISFNPFNSTRLCTTGASGLFQFWHYTPKHVLNAPVNTQRNDTYTCHVWMENDCVIAGTDRGDVSVVLGCEVMQHQHAFGSTSDHSFIHASVARIIKKDNKVVAYSLDGFLAVLELHRKEGKAGHGPTASLTLLHRCILQDTPRIQGMAWVSKDIKSFHIAVASLSCIRTFDVMATEELIPPETVEPVTLPTDDEFDAENNISPKTSFMKKNTPPKSPPPGTSRILLRGQSDHYGIAKRWAVLPHLQTLMRYHSGSINAMAHSVRNSLMLTSSLKDESVRLWDCARHAHSEIFVEDLSQRRNELPLSVDMHPSGLMAIFGCDDDIKEYAITDVKLELTRKIPMKVAIISNNGDPIINSAPVSLVRYSHGGHLIAGITGRIAHIFHAYNLSYDVDKSGTPSRLMTLTEHTAFITDFAFSKDDTKFFTSAADGSVYEWTMGRINRDSEYCMKNIPAIRIAVSPLQSYIVAAFESDYTPANKRLTLMRSQSRSGQNSEPDRVGAIRRTGARGGSSSPPPLSRALSSSGERPGTAAKNKCFVGVWSEHISTTVELYEMEIPVTSVCFGQLETREVTEICILGLANGNVLISLLPLPGRSFVPSVAPTFNPGFYSFGSQSVDLAAMRSTNITRDSVDFFDMPARKTPALGSPHRAQSPPADVKPSTTIDTSRCREFQLHSSAVTRLNMSQTGLWIYSAGNDGSIFMIACSLKAFEMLDIPESLSSENQIVLTDKPALRNQLIKIDDKDLMLEEMRKDKERTVATLEAKREAAIAELDATMKREISKRDDIIMHTRNDLINTRNKLNKEIDNIREEHRVAIAEVEVMYEKKLATEQMYIMNMKQAYDEFVTHARFDLEEFQRLAQQREAALHAEKNDIVDDTEKQKRLLLEYCNYVTERHKEILKSMTEAHDNKRHKLDQELQNQTLAVENIKNQKRNEETKAIRQIHILRQEMNSKDLDLLDKMQEIERMRDRMTRLETALQNAMAEIQRKNEAVDRWEVKSGAQQQQLNELERIRKALISQLHALREEIGPKDIKVIETTEKLTEVDREYEKCLKAVSEKEQKLQQYANMFQLLQKQVRELRTSLNGKEGALRRAASLLDEFHYALKESRFNSRKITVKEGSDEAKKFKYGVGEVMELISSTPEMEAALKRLNDVLNPHSTYEDAIGDSDARIIEEYERQISLMRKNITGLKTNIHLVDEVATKKAKHYLTDNENLLQQMNAMRHEIGLLKEENQRLIAMMDMKRNKQKSKSLAESSKNTQSMPSFTLDPLSPARDDYDIQNGCITGITREELEQLYASEARRNSSSVSGPHGAAGLATPSLESYTPRSFLDRLQLQNATETTTEPHSGYKTADEKIAELMESNQRDIVANLQTETEKTEAPPKSKKVVAVVDLSFQNKTTSAAMLKKKKQEMVKSATAEGTLFPAVHNNKTKRK